MAFVYQAPRNLYVQQQEISSDEESGTNHQSLSPSLKKSPCKGLAYKITQNKSDQDSSENKIFSDALIHEPKQVKNNKQNIKLNLKEMEKIKNSHCSNFMFKSKLKRFPLIEKSINDRSPSPQPKFVMEKKIVSVHKPKKYMENINLLSVKKKQEKISYIPSIPSKVEKHGYVLTDDCLSFPTSIIQKSRFDGDKNNSPGPCQYNVNKNKKVKNVLSFGKPQQNQLKFEQFKEQNYDCPLVEDQEALKLHNEKIRQWVEKGKEEKRLLLSKIKKHKYEIKKKEISENQDSEQSYEYEYDTTPGPGYYTYDPFVKKNYRSSKKQFQKVFYSQIDRFHTKTNSTAQTTACDYEENEQQIKKRNQNYRFYISKLPRQFMLLNNSIAPPPGSYDPRNSIENSAMNNIINKSNKIFDNKIPRLPDYIKTDVPGPGSYDLSRPNFKVQSSFVHENGTFITSFRNHPANQEQKVKKKEEELICGSPKKHMRIHERKDEEFENVNYAPFMSSNFKSQNSAQTPQNNKKITLYPKKQSKSPQNKYPFNSSEPSKPSNLIKKQEFIASVGMYELGNTYQWNKKSYNMYFH